MKFKNKAISALLLSTLFATTAFADLNGSVEIKDEQGNTIGTSRMLEVQNTSVQLRNQLSENDKNFIKYAYKNLSESDIEILEEANKKVNDYIFFMSNTKKKKLLDALVDRLDEEIFDLIMSYPADAPMSKSDTRKYLILNTFKLETYAKSW